jgi:hypothetical protein
MIPLAIHPASTPVTPDSLMPKHAKISTHITYWKVAVRLAFRTVSAL